jgi:hypothetical protein
LYLQEDQTALVISGSVIGVTLPRCSGCLIEAREGCITCRHGDLTAALRFTELYARRITALSRKERRGFDRIRYMCVCVYIYIYCDMTAKICSETKRVAVARQRHGKYVSTAMNQRAATEDLLEAVFYAWSTSSLYNKNQQEKLVIQRSAVSSS